MCGIAGLLHFDGRPADPLLVQRMGEAVRHRGPDGEGLFVDGPVGLAHRRLAIIDLSPAGHQPMATADGRFVLSYNGEIYNFKELRIELQALGCQFRSCSDSEVVLYALAEWGVEALSRFNGMFAIAMWDRHERALLLARDRYGIKPLYWARKQSFAIFGSEVKALLAHPEFPAAIDTAALFEYMTFQNFLGERILFKGVHLLAAASWVRLGADGTSRTGSF